MRFPLQKHHFRSRPFFNNRLLEYMESRQCFVCNNNIIIITLFQEDNIFGRVASLTYGPQLTNVGHDIIKMNRHACTNIYSMYRVNALRTPSRLRAGYPTLLQWRGRYDFSRLKTSRVLPHTSVLVIECFLTRSMLFLKCIYTHYYIIYSHFFHLHNIRNAI